MATASDKLYGNQVKVVASTEEHRSVDRRQSLLEDGPEHVPVAKFLADNFPILTSNEYFRVLYDWIMKNYWAFVNSLIVDYILGWILVFVPLLNPAILLFNFCYWTVWKMMIRPIFVFWKKMCDVIGFSVVIFSVWEKTLNMIDICGNGLLNAFVFIYVFVRNTWDKIVADSKEMLNHIAQQASEVLKTTVRLVKILYSYLEQLSVLVLSEQAEDFIVSIAMTIYRVVRWFYRLNKLYQTTCDAAIKIIIDTWKEIPANVPSVRSKHSGKDSSSGHSASAPHHKAHESTHEIHEVSSAGASHHDETSFHH